MLVLERDIDEAILIGDDIEVVLLGVRCQGVRLGIRAPNYVRIRRRTTPGALMVIVEAEVDEDIVIGEDIQVTVIRTRGHFARIGVQAPDNVHILRKEKHGVAREPVAAPAA